MPKRVKIDPYFGVGNQVFQYLMAVALAEEGDGTVEISGYSLPDFQLVNTEVVADQGFRIIIHNHIVPQTGIISLMADCPHIDIIIKALSCRMCYYSKHLEKYRELFCLRKCETEPKFGSKYIVISIRSNEILRGIHPHYFPLPLSWYEQVIKSSGLSPVFVGQWANQNIYCAALRDKFPTAMFCESKSAREDFNLLAGSENIILSISTFAWLAAWMSPISKNIFMPVSGLYDARTRPDIDLLPITDSRFQFYDLELPAWDGSNNFVQSLISGKKSYSPITKEKLRLTTNGILGTEGLNIIRPPLN